MRRLVLLGALLAACAGAAASLPKATAPVAAPAAPPAVSYAAPELFLVNGPLAMHTENGARLPIANGWVEARLSNFPPGPIAELDVLVISKATNAPARADVTVSYDMAQMEHGLIEERAHPGAGGHHAAKLELWMLDAWRIKIQIVLEGVPSDIVLLVAPKS